MEQSATRRGGISVYDRVIHAGKIRCGYVVYPPGSFKDPNSGRLYGIAIETLERAGKNLGLSIEWTEEVGWGSMIEGLEANRYDMIGNVVWANSTRGKVMDFSLPLFFSPIEVYTRAGDTRFDQDLQSINTASVKISTIDGEMSDIISRSQFPAAARVSLPQLSDVSQALLNVKQKRADVAFVEPYIAEQFIKNNPDSLRQVPERRPLRIFGNCYMFRTDQPAFKSMIDTAVEELLDSGFVDQLVRKYTPANSVLLPALPYRANASGAASQ